LSILLAAVDLQPDDSLRRRAVHALGELGDGRALDVLLKIVNEAGHPLQAEAAEALGHLGRSAKSDEVLELLEGLARGNDHLAGRALEGLRWLDRAEGWQLIRRRAGALSDPLQAPAAKLLGDHDEQATRDLLRRLLTETRNTDVFENALTSARKLWGHDSLEPDYAALQNGGTEDADDLLRRVQERGDAKRLLEILPRAGEEVAARLREILLQRQPPPVAEARAVVSAPDAAAAGVAANLLGRAGDATAGPAVASALRRWWEEYDRLRQDETRRGAKPGQRAGVLSAPLKALARAAGLLGSAAEVLSAIALTRTGVAYDRPLRHAAVAALATGKPSGPALAALERFATGADPEIRALAAEAVARADAARGATLAGKSLADRVAFNRLADRARVEVGATLRGAAAQVHYQGVAVPHLAARGDVKGLAAVAGNAGFNEETRLGAVEGLAAAARPEAEEELVRIGKADGQPEELRKAAWRGLRRSRRARAAQGGKAK
jgi:ParB family chromosome partitioning protein